MPLATLDDINLWLPADKLVMTDLLDDPYQLDAERIIKGYLSTTYSATTLAGWSDPTVNQASQYYVPSIIRGIAGRFIASFYYGKQFSSESTDVPQYAQKLYDDAWDLLRKIQSGEIVLTDEADEMPDTGVRLSEADFYPNSPDTDPPKFAMSREF